MPNWKTVYGDPLDEEKWKKAKERAEEEGHAKDWAYIVGIYKRMAKTGEFKPKFSKQREKSGETVSEWKGSHLKWKVTAHKPNPTMNTVKSMGDMLTTDHMRLVLVKGELDEFRCGSCNALLFKGLNLEKSMIEVKCRSCGTLLVSDGLFML